MRNGDIITKRDDSYHALSMGWRNIWFRYTDNCSDVTTSIVDKVHETFTSETGTRRVGTYSSGSGIDGLNHYTIEDIDQFFVWRMSN